jgi:prepilin-type N-terminal cleavage/methylation domain-containing protein
LRILREQHGFTLVEILIVITLMTVLLSVTLVSLLGFMGRGKSQAYNVDRRTIQNAVDAYYAESYAGLSRWAWPTRNGSDGTCVVTNTSGLPLGTCTDASDAYISFTDLYAANYLLEIPDSASSYNTGGTDGSYIWFIYLSGTVSSSQPDTGVRGFISDIYP